MLTGLLEALSLTNLTYIASGSVLGLIIGAAPGLGPVFGLALFLSMTFTMTPAGAIIFMASLYASCVYGGSITSILLNTPGTPGNVATCFDGYAMTKKGEAGRALGISTLSSFIGGIVGVMALLLLGPFLARASLLIGPSEFFLLALTGLLLVALASKGNTIKGIIMCGLGLMLSFVGRSIVTGERRFYFGTVYLEDGIQFVPVVIGAFAFAQILVLANEFGAISGLHKNVRGFWKGCRDVLHAPVTVIRSAILGTLIGIMPGLGINAANFIAYVVEKNASKDPESFGTGNPKGLMAPETANNACTTAALIPAFGLGVPGSASAALFLSALMIHGLQPGYSFYNNNGNLFGTIIWGMLLAQLAFFVLGAAGAKYFAKITQVPNSMLVPIIMILCFVGSYSYRAELMDVVVMLAAGIAGYYLQKLKYPLACLILGMILGNLAEDNFSRAMLLSRNSLSIFFTRPISLVLVVLIIVSFGYPVIKQYFKKKTSSKVT